ncbi:MAG TPA: phytoene/squalene synthase family protein [Ilumatobacter sp.]
MNDLDRSYEECRRIARRHGTTYYWAAALLPRRRRRDVWALYALARLADDLVDELAGRPVAERAAALDALSTRFFRDLAAGNSDDLVLAAVVHTVRTLEIDPLCFHEFFGSMTMDLAIAGYDTWQDLTVYMNGSAAAIGEMMLPVLEPTTPAALKPARDLGLAFQLTNFLRDVGEDLDRGRVYLPREDLENFGSDPAARRVDDHWRRLMRFEIERARELYRSADRGLAMLPASSARCVHAARTLYSQILDRIEAADYDVFASRARVPTWRKLATVGASIGTSGQSLAYRT